LAVVEAFEGLDVVTVYRSVLRGNPEGGRARTAMGKPEQVMSSEGLADGAPLKKQRTMEAPPAATVKAAPSAPATAAAAPSAAAQDTDAAPSSTAAVSAPEVSERV
jgi:hypothetical protein